MITQAIITLTWMLYAWNNPEQAASFSSPKKYRLPYFSFTALIPVRFEHEVIQDTITAIAELNYPPELKEIILICRDDDSRTQEVIKKTLQSLPTSHTIHLEIISDGPINKPYSLNAGLKKAKNNIIAVFDAEDQPHKDIYNIINTLFIEKQTDVIQSGIQLINYKSRWFSLLNVLEYFFWFKSGLQFFNKIGGITPLGGNTVFFKRELLDQLNGWKTHHLTEDAEIGIRLASHGAKCSIVYDEQHVTFEESPLTINSFIKQRTRWDQGFLQVFWEGEWKNLPTLKQRFFVLYILLSPLIPIIFLLYIPLSIILLLTVKLPVSIALFSFIPLYLYGFQMITYILGFWEFTKVYKFRRNILLLLKIPFIYYLYQLLLAIAALRAIWRQYKNNSKWEKTKHTNIHRKGLELNYASI